MAFLGSPITSPLLLGRDPPALRPKSPGEFGVLGETISGTSGKVQVRTVVTTIVIGSSPRLADRHLAGFLLHDNG